MDFSFGIGRAGFQQQDLDGWVFGKTVSEYASGRACAHNDVIVHFSGLPRVPGLVTAANPRYLSPGIYSRWKNYSFHGSRNPSLPRDPLPITICSLVPHIGKAH